MPNRVTIPAGGVRNRPRVTAVALAAVVVWAGGCGRLAAPATVHVDNYSDHEVRVVVDDLPPLVCPPGTTRPVQLPSGGHRLTVAPPREGDKPEAFEVHLDRGGTYVLNCLGVQAYVHTEVSYTTGGPGYSPRDPRVRTDRWFRAEEDFVFVEPPSTILVSGGSGPVTRTVLRRGQVDTPPPDERRTAEADLRAIGEAYERGRSATRVGVTDPIAPQGPSDMSWGLRQPVADRYEIVWAYAGAFGRQEPDARLAWSRDPQPDGSRTVLMGDFRTVRVMDAGRFAITPRVTPQAISPRAAEARPLTTAPRLGTTAAPSRNVPVTRPDPMAGPSAEEMRGIIRSNEAFRASALGRPLRPGE